MRHIVDVLIVAGEYGCPFTLFDFRIVVKRYLDKSGTKCRYFTDNTYQAMFGL